MWKIENCVQSIFRKRIRFLILFPNDRVPVIIKILKNRVEIWIKELWIKNFVHVNR